MRVVAYYRVSTAHQEEKGTIRTQDDVAERYCAASGHALLDKYVDDGVSGSIPIRERPDGARLWADALAHKFDLILIFDLSRLARATIEILTAMEFFKSHDIGVRSLTQDYIDTSTSHGLYFLTGLAASDQFMRDKIREQSRYGLERIVRAGEWAGGKPPFGYRIVDKHVAIDPVQSEIVRDIFKWYLSGDIRVRGIAKRLNALDVKHSISERWWDTTVSKLLRNRAYVGEIVWRKRTNRRKVAGKWVCTKTTDEQQIKRAIPAIISDKDFERAQRMLTANRSGRFRNVKNFYLVRGLVFCRECGSKYRGMTSGRNPWMKTYYRCASHISTSQIPPCRGKAVRADILDAAVWDYCLSFAQNPGQVIEELRKVMQAKQDNQHESRVNAARLEKQIATKRQGRAETIKLHRRGVITEDEAARDLSDLESEVRALEEQRQEFLSALEVAEDAEFRLLSVESMLNLIAEKVSSASLDLMREVVVAWVSRIEIETVSEGKRDRGVAHVSFAFRPSPEAVTSEERAVATSKARFAAC